MNSVKKFANTVLSAAQRSGVVWTYDDQINPEFIAGPDGVLPFVMLHARKEADARQLFQLGHRFHFQANKRSLLGLSMSATSTNGMLTPAELSTSTLLFLHALDDMKSTLAFLFEKQHEWGRFYTPEPGGRSVRIDVQAIARLCYLQYGDDHWGIEETNRITQRLLASNGRNPDELFSTAAPDGGPHLRTESEPSSGSGLDSTFSL